MLNKPIKGANLKLALQQNNKKFKEYVDNIVKDFFKNRTVLEKISESESGELLYDSKVIGKEYTDKEVDDAVDKILGTTSE